VPEFEQRKKALDATRRKALASPCELLAGLAAAAPDLRLRVVNYASRCAPLLCRCGRFVELNIGEPSGLASAICAGTNCAARSDSTLAGTAEPQLGTPGHYGNSLW
jgi:hypothetical protein